MQLRESLILACTLLLGVTGFAADPSPMGEKLPSPTPVPEAVPQGYFELMRSPTDEAAELSSTRDFETYVYVVNGADVIHVAGMKKLADRIRRSGYPHTKFGEWYDMASFEAEFRKIRAECLNARVVLIGYDLGAYMVRAAANRLVRDGFPVAMVGYVGGEGLTNTEYSRPTGVPRVVNVTGKGLLMKATSLDGSANVNVPVMSYSLPSRPETFHALYMGLTGLSTNP